MRMNVTKGCRVERIDGGNWDGVKSSPAIRDEPDEPSATSFVYN